MLLAQYLLRFCGSLSILTATFQVNLGYPVFVEAKDDGSDGDNWSYKTCKAPVKSSPPTNQQQKCSVKATACQQISLQWSIVLDRQPKIIHGATELNRRSLTEACHSWNEKSTQRKRKYCVLAVVMQGQKFSPCHRHPSCRHGTAKI